jgi:DNA-binding MarR family transcriptional regulator
VSNHSVVPDISSASNEDAIGTAVERYRELVQLLSGARTPELPDSSVTMAQMRALMVLSAIGQMRMSEAATALGVSQSTASGLIDRLVESGLVTRRSDDRDRRQVLVSLTADGIRFLDHFQELGMSHLRALLGQLHTAGIATVNNAIELLIDAARRMSVEDLR